VLTKPPRPFRKTYAQGVDPSLTRGESVTEYRKGSRYGTELGMVAVVETSRSERIASEMMTLGVLTSGEITSAFPAEQVHVSPSMNSE
jgi:hypothetical protein